MKVSGFSAAADLVGRRVRLSWVLEAEGAETLADAPAVVVWRKIRDWDFPNPVPPSEIAYDEANFPVSASLVVVELPDTETTTGIQRVVCSVASVARVASGITTEVLRRTMYTTIGEDGIARLRTVEILDTGDEIGGLIPGRPYYYQLYTGAVPADPAPFRASAAAGETHGYGRLLYEMLPQIWRRHDVVTAPASVAATVIPEANPRTGQLRRLVDLFGLGTDALRSSADGLRLLHDVDGVASRFLEPLAHWVGWTLTQAQEVPVQRNELKSAARLYRGVGTIPGIRAIVTRYSSWHTQVAEFVQGIARANDPARPAIHATALTPDGWIGAAEVADVLGFGVANQSAAGSGTLPATLTGSVVGPFALRPGQELTLRLDGAPAVAVRFGAHGFVDMRQASAAEVALAIAGAAIGVEASADSFNRLVLRTRTSGPDANISVEPSSTSLVALETAPGGRISAFVDARGHLRMFYDVARAPAETEASSATTVGGGSTCRGIGVQSSGAGIWRNPEILEDPASPHGSPVAIELPDGRIWLATIARPATGAAELRTTLGAPRTETPARIIGERRGPFRLVPGTVLTLLVDGAPDQFTVIAADYANPNAATTAEVVVAMNLQLTTAQVVALADGSLAVASISVGPDASLRVELQLSTAARALGLMPKAGARGAWDERIDWGMARMGLPAGRGWLADPAVAVHPDGGIRVFWSEHRDERWRIISAFWDERVLVATNAGVGRRTAAGVFSTWDTLAGLPDNDVRSLAVDADGSAWFATAGGGARRSSNGVWTVFPAANPGLPTNDLRAVTAAPDGSVWFGTTSGVAVRDPSGIWVRYQAGTGLSNDDVRAVLVGLDGIAWVATAAGLSERSSTGTWRTWTAADLGNDDVRALAQGPDGMLWVATAAGLLRRETSGAWTSVALPTALLGTSVRALAVDGDGRLWAATSGGVGAKEADGTWPTWSTASGLPSNDTRSVVISDDQVWVGTAAGVAVRADGIWSSFTTGLPAADVRTIVGGWSSVATRASGGGANRGAAALVDAAGRTWLIWSQRQGIGTPEDQWLLRQCRHDPTVSGGTWLAEAAVTTAAPGAAIADREPGLLVDSAVGIQVYFRSNRAGAEAIWRLDLDASGVPGALQAITGSPARDATPAPVWAGPDVLWLLFRSDRNLPLARVAAAIDVGDRTHRVPDEGSLRRIAGTTATPPTELTRNSQRQLWGDLLSYTVQRPEVPDLADLGGGDLYTRGTIGLYVTRGRYGQPLTTEGALRLRQILSEFLPINLRAVLFLAPSPDLEILYPEGADIGESYIDSYPNIDVYTGLMDASAASLPDWEFLMSNTAGHLSADLADLTTLRRRTWFAPPPSEEEP